ncbi:MAG: hypothetical protein AAGL24_10605 [Pseudomonadota bacterium]
MIQISSLGEANGAARCGASGKPFNEADGLIWFTEGRIFSTAGRRCDHLVVVETTAATAPSQQSGKYGQMVHHYHPML